MIYCVHVYLDSFDLYLLLLSEGIIDLFVHSCCFSRGVAIVIQDQCVASSSFMNESPFCL